MIQPPITYKIPPPPITHNEMLNIDNLFPLMCEKPTSDNKFILKIIEFLQDIKCLIFFIVKKLLSYSLLTPLLNAYI